MDYLRPESEWEVSDLPLKRFCWLAGSAWKDMTREAQEKYPLETGGVLVGYWLEDGRDVVVTAISGPGPKAIHAEWEFTPDYIFHDEFVAATYARSGRRYVYLGDWHTHPDGGTKLSPVDKSTLRGISRSPHARIVTPVMAIVASDAGDWQASFWNYRPGAWRRMKPFGRFIELSLRTY